MGISHALGPRNCPRCKETGIPCLRPSEEEAATKASVWKLHVVFHYPWGPWTHNHIISYFFWTHNRSYFVGMYYNVCMKYTPTYHVAHWTRPLFGQLCWEPRGQRPERAAGALHEKLAPHRGTRRGIGLREDGGPRWRSALWRSLCSDAWKNWDLNGPCTCKYVICVLYILCIMSYVLICFNIHKGWRWCVLLCLLWWVNF